MSASLLQKLLLPIGIVTICLAASVPLSAYLSDIRPQLPEAYEDTDLSMKASRLRGFLLGAEGLFADFFFMRNLQYVGNKILNAKSEDINLDDLRNLNPRLVYPMLDTATSLDPHFVGAYSFGAMLLPAIDPEKAIALGVKGVTNNPNEWRLFQHLGYIYWRLKRYDEAAEIYARGSQIPGSAPFMKLMSGTMRTEGGSRETARAIFRQMLADADPEDQQTRNTAQNRLNEIEWLDERDAIDGVLANFKEKAGRCATSFSEITPMLMTASLPDNRDFRVNNRAQLVDPSGAPYILDKENCRVKLDLALTTLPVEGRKK